MEPHQAAHLRRDWVSALNLPNGYRGFSTSDMTRELERPTRYSMFSPQWADCLACNVLFSLARSVSSRLAGASSV